MWQGWDVSLGSWHLKLCRFHSAKKDSRNFAGGLGKVRSVGTQNQEGQLPTNPGVTQELGWGKSTQGLVEEAREGTWQGLTRTPASQIPVLAESHRKTHHKSPGLLAELGSGPPPKALCFLPRLSLSPCKSLN